MKFLIIFSLCLSLTSFGQSKDINQLLRSKLDTVSEAPIYNISVYTQKGNKKANAYLAGNRKKHGAKAQITDQFRIASSTKIFVSTIILQLEEEGKIKLDDKINTYLNDMDYLRLDEFHSLEEQYFTTSITIKQLLSHRSGLADIFNDRQAAFFTSVIKNPNKQYQPKDMVNLYFEYGLNKEAKFQPGKDWHYSDMNYILLGLLIEKTDNKTLSQSIRERIVKPLGLGNTYFEFYEESITTNDRLHQYVGTLDFNQVDTSFDWSGGGLVSTHQDLALFIKSLFEGKLIKMASLEKMIDAQPTKPTELPYGLGIYKSNYAGEYYYGHYGFYGSYIGYAPESKTVLSYCVTQATPMFNTYTLINSIVKMNN